MSPKHQLCCRSPSVAHLMPISPKTQRRLSLHLTCDTRIALLTLFRAGGSLSTTTIPLLQSMKQAQLTSLVAEIDLAHSLPFRYAITIEVEEDGDVAWRKIT
ncbi:hypothetical protein JTE90_002704 [Oedothorax gibbosus]|uniref:Uncharacterized protein n=1 Tax=Oedothorax gibbosus TaxID=931172 RepID=A0AAV6VZQ7_9ARAC|nr:hypothetical protein JTE90_002704 [Oedothorax gibbosus]